MNRFTDFNKIWIISFFFLYITLNKNLIKNSFSQDLDDDRMCTEKKVEYCLIVKSRLTS